MAYTVYLDAGHGGYDNGATYEGRREKDDVLRLALAVGDLLEKNGVTVGYTRTNDVYDSPTQKAQIANSNGADLFVSFHRNSNPIANRYSGVETLIYDNSGLKVELANNINRQLEEVGFRNLGLNIRPNLAVLRRTKMPSVLVEVGFINTDADNKLYDEKFYEIANAIATGILETIQRDTLYPDTIYSIQVGLYRNPENANNMVRTLLSQGFSARIIPIGEFYAVLVGNVADYEKAVALENRLRMLGYDTLIVQ